MAVNVTKPALNLRELLAKVASMKPAPREQTFFFGGDSAKTAFPLPRGWKVKNVFVDGGIYRPGASEDYTVTYDGFTQTVSMAVAPAFVDVAIIAETV